MALVIPGGTALMASFQGFERYGHPQFWKYGGVLPDGTTSVALCRTVNRSEVSKRYLVYLKNSTLLRYS